MTRHIALSLPSLAGGGAEGVMTSLAGGFAQRGVRTDLVSPQPAGPNRSRVPAAVRIVDLRARRVLTSLPRLVHYLRREQPEAMLATLEHANIMALWARRLARTRTTIVIREANTISREAQGHSLDSLKVRLMRRYYPLADAVVAVSCGAAADLAATIGLPRERIRVIYNPVLVDDIRAKAREPLDHPWFGPDQPPIVLGMGRLSRQKDFCTLIRAFAQVRAVRPARLLILGEGEDRPHLQALVRELALDGDVALPGFASNPFPYMARAAVFALSSAWEGLSNVLLEALACGVPVASTDCASGPAEILEDGRLGRLVPVGDHVALAEAILETLGKPRGGEDLQRSMERFSLQRIVDDYLSILH
ncbi:MAG: glycosyltransferase [Anaerolineae bacterium]